MCPLEEGNHWYIRGIGRGGGGSGVGGRGSGGGVERTPFLGAKFIHFLYKVLGQISCAKITL